jgi:acylphosphatase
MIARHIVIHGRVHGVGYRDAMLEVTHDYPVQGWVRNRRDGTVEAWLQGPEAAVGAILTWCRRGPPAARVTEVAVLDRAVDDTLTCFTRRPTG